MPTHFPPAFDAYVEPARDRSEIWRTLLGFVLVALVFIVATLGLSAAVIFIGEKIETGRGFQLVFMLQSGTSVFATFTLVGLIIFILPALWLVMRYLHNRSFMSLISPEKRINWRYWQVGAIVVLLFGIADATLTLSTQEVIQQHTFLAWLPLAIAGIIVIFLQTAAEELVFRGYLQQQLAARFQSRWIWLIIPSILFGSLHYNPGTFGDNTWLVMAVAATIGLIAGDLTARLGNLSAALGIHFANNILVFMFLNVKGQASGAALFLHDMNPKAPETASGLVLLVVIMLAIYGGFLLVWKRRRL